MADKDVFKRQPHIFALIQIVVIIIIITATMAFLYSSQPSDYSLIILSESAEVELMGPLNITIFVLNSQDQELTMPDLDFEYNIMFEIEDEDERVAINLFTKVLRIPDNITIPANSEYQKTFDLTAHVGDYVYWYIDPEDGGLDGGFVFKQGTYKIRASIVDRSVSEFDYTDVPVICTSNEVIIHIT